MKINKIFIKKTRVTIPDGLIDKSKVLKVISILKLLDY